MSDIISAVSRTVRDLGDSLMPHFAEVEPIVKDDGSWLTEADRHSHEVLLRKLREIVDLPVLSEELSDSEQQAIISESKAGYWCVDPLDGTSNYTLGIPYWCISVGLVIEGNIRLGVIYDPNREECFTAIDDEPTRLNGSIVQTTPAHDLYHATALIDLKRLPQNVVSRLISDYAFRSQRCFGASALDLCWIAMDRCQLYLHGEQKLWDYVAGKRILLNSGGHCESFSGDSVFQNDLEPRPIIAASSDKLMSQWRDYFQSIQSS